MLSIGNGFDFILDRSQILGKSEPRLFIKLFLNDKAFVKNTTEK